jgi:hypothetical protein
VGLQFPAHKALIIWLFEESLKLDQKGTTGIGPIEISMSSILYSEV